MQNENDEESQLSEFGAVKIQSIVRMILARKAIIKKINQRFEKIYDPRRKRHYYYDSAKDKSSWLKPRLLRSSDILTISPTYTKEAAATLVQKQARRFLALLNVRLKYQETVVPVLDDTSGLTYFTNSQSGVSMWELPSFMKGSLTFERKPLQLTSSADQEPQSGRRRSTMRKRKSTLKSRKSSTNTLGSGQDSVSLRSAQAAEDQTAPSEEKNGDEDEDEDEKGDAQQDDDDEEDDDEDDDDDEEEDDDDYASDDSEAVRDRRRQRRKFPR
jgi:hypothetical protein